MNDLIGMPASEALEILKEAESQRYFSSFDNMKLDKDGSNAVFYNHDNPIAEVGIRDDNWLKYFSEIAGLPLEYVKTLEAPIYDKLINYHVNKTPQERYNGQNKSAIVQKKGTDEFGIVSSLQKYAAPSEVLDMYLKYFKGDTRVHRLNTSSDSIEFSILCDEWNMSFLNKSDISYFGLSVEWPGSCISPMVFASSHRPTCGNIMHIPRNLGRINSKFRTINRGEVMSRFDKAGNKSVSYVNNVLIPQLTKSVETSVDNAVQFIAQMCETHGLNEHIEGTLLEALRKEPGNMLYHVIQAMTFATTHLLEKYEHIEAVNKVLRILLDGTDDTDECILCHHSIG